MSHYLKNHKCAAVSCKELPKIQHPKLFRFPANEQRYRLWAEVTENPKLLEGKRREAYLCARHFNCNQFADEDCTRLVYRSIPLKHPTFPPKELSLVPGMGPNYPKPEDVADNINDKTCRTEDSSSTLPKEQWQQMTVKEEVHSEDPVGEVEVGWNVMEQELTDVETPEEEIIANGKANVKGLPTVSVVENEPVECKDKEESIIPLSSDERSLNDCRQENKTRSEFSHMPGKSGLNGSQFPIAIRVVKPELTPRLPNVLSVGQNTPIPKLIPIKSPKRLAGLKSQILKQIPLESPKRLNRQLTKSQERVHQISEKISLDALKRLNGQKARNHMPLLCQSCGTLNRHLLLYLGADGDCRLFCSSCGNPLIPAYTEVRPVILLPVEVPIT